MPSSWHPEALKAQAVVARTYALVSRKSGSWLSLYDDTRSQVYGGVPAETAATNAAVDGTSGQVVRSGGAFAWTFYHSTSGGKTASRRGRVGAARDPVPRQRPRRARQHLAPPQLGPHRRRRRLPQRGSRLRLDGGRRSSAPWAAGRRTRSADFVVTARNSSSRVATATLSGPPAAKTITGATLRSLLGLRSTWFTIGTVRLTGAGSIARGQSRKLHALARAMPGAKLQKKVGTGAWVSMRAIQGAVNVTVRPTVTTLYRVFSPSGSTAAVKVRVGPQPRFGVDQSSRALSGTSEPGESVQVQRLGAKGAWVTVAVALADEDGTWRAALHVVPGRYRAYVSSGGARRARAPSSTVVAG